MSVKYLIPSVAIRYIERHGLYVLSPSPLHLKSWRKGCDGSCSYRRADRKQLPIDSSTSASNSSSTPDRSSLSPSPIPLTEEAERERMKDRESDRRRRTTAVDDSDLSPPPSPTRTAEDARNRIQELEDSIMSTTTWRHTLDDFSTLSSLYPPFDRPKKNSALSSFRYPLSVQSPSSFNPLSFKPFQQQSSFPFEQYPTTFPFFWCFFLL